MNICLLILGCGFLAALVWYLFPDRHDPRLNGTWRSNKDETLAAWKRDGILTPRIIERFENEVLGKTTITSARRRVTMSSDNWNEVQYYKVIETGSDYVVYDLYSKVWKAILRHKVQFVESGYWVYNDDIFNGFFEKFDRVT